MKVSTLLKRCLTHLAHTHKRDEHDWNVLSNLAKDPAVLVTRAQRVALLLLMDSIETELSRWIKIPRMMMREDMRFDQRQELRFDTLCMLIEFNKIEESR